MIDETDDLIECDSHGSVPWHGHLICDACDAVHDGQKLPMDARCPCGRRLLPKADVDDSFTGRAICATCYHQRVETPAKV